MSENSREERILAYLLEECDEAEGFEVERLCRENPLWQKDKVHYGQVLGLVRDAVTTPIKKELPEQECKLTDRQRADLRNLLPHQPDENVNQKVESPSMNAKDPKRKKLITLGVPLAAAAMAVAIAYWANSESTETPDKQIAAATVSNEREPVPLTNGNQSEKQPASYLPVPTPAFTSNSTLAMKMAIQEEAGQVLAQRTAREIKEMENQMVNDLPSVKKVLNRSNDKNLTTESKPIASSPLGIDASSSLADAFSNPLDDSSKALDSLKEAESKKNQLNSAANKIDNSVVSKNKWYLVLQNPEESFIFNEKGDSLGKIRLSENLDGSLLFQRANWPNKNRSFKLEPGDYEIRLSRKPEGTLILKGQVKGLEDNQYEFKAIVAWQLDQGEKRISLPLEELSP